jgi:hypothetical protein
MTGPGFLLESGVVGRLLYSLAMRENASWKALLAQACFCVWIVIAQVWYYSQFKSLFAPVLKTMLRAR